MIKIGDTIDSRYLVLSHLGTGGMAVVFECKDLFSKTRVAVKIMKEELLDDSHSVKNFQDEVKASVSMHHENIINIFQEGIYNKRPYLVMEYLQDQTLLDKIEYFTKFSVKEAIQIMRQLLDAISYTHEHKIIHRDIKPQNVFYLPNGLIKLADFGISSKEQEVQNNNQILGTVQYLSPEVLQGKPFSVQSDIYAAGVTFFQLITGRIPFDGSTKEIADAHIKKAFPKASSFNNQIPAEVDEIILKATKKNPKARYQSAREFKTALENYLEGKKNKRSLFDLIFK